MAKENELKENEKEGQGMIPGQQNTRIVDPRIQNHRNDIHSKSHCLKEIKEEKEEKEREIEGKSGRRQSNVKEMSVKRMKDNIR